MTASAAGISRALGQFDIKQMQKFRDLAERHLQNALNRAGGIQRLTAAADPNQFITESMIDEFVQLGYEAWNDGYSLLASLAPDQLSALYSSVIDGAVQDASMSYYDLLNKLIGDKAFKTLYAPDTGEFLQGKLVQYGDIRPLLVKLGGGSPDSRIDQVGGITTGRISNDILGEAGIDMTGKFIWLYGYEDIPRRVFNGHLQMDGIVFEDWNEDGLEVAPQDDWLRVSHYFPGDHYGCSCIVAPFVPNWGEDYQLSEGNIGTEYI